MIVIDLVLARATGGYLGCGRGSYWFLRQSHLCRPGVNGVGAGSQRGHEDKQGMHTGRRQRMADGAPVYRFRGGYHEA
jgi:hypothetical protein